MILGLCLWGCSPPGLPLPPEERVAVPGSGTVVVDVEAPKSIAGPLLKLFESQTGITAQATYLDPRRDDVVGRVKSDVAAGRADLVWAVSPLTAMALAEAGLTVPFRPAGARPIPGQYRDPRFHWIGFAADPRVIIYNSERLSHDEAPQSIEDLEGARWSGKVAMARIARGTAAFHAAALFTRWGAGPARAFFDKVRANGARVVADDAEVIRLVASGEALWGFVDLDAAIAAKREAQPIHIFFPDRMALGAIVPPQVAVLLRGAPHPAQAKGLFAYFFETEAAYQLAQNDRALVPLLPDIPKPDWVPSLPAFNVTQIDNQAVFQSYRDNAAYFESWGASVAPGDTPKP
ncbi:MAG TPA: extracellular solute-binding protein [Candidatus Polarisedimenticolia bacterium]|nr:extracellular solute-binding protein [Candidatus Polarisedimenticolia bacterium]